MQVTTRINTHKSGQAAIVLVVVTVMTVLGIAVASSSQTTINLRDTVYSTQAAQALACAEAGIDRALIQPAVQNEQLIVGTLSPTLRSSDIGFAVDGCDNYDAQISRYPLADGQDLTIVDIPENVVQELRIAELNTLNVRFRSNIDGRNAGLAVYRYYRRPAPNDQEWEVSRHMLFCNEGGEPATAPTQDFTSLAPIGDYCESPIPLSPGASEYLRVRPLFANVWFEIPQFRGQTGFEIVSSGTAGSVNRVVNVLRFFSQLGEAFDESIVSFSEEDPLGDPDIGD